MSRYTTSRAAFTLLELAIVISIIGLIVGGVLSGRSLVRGAEINAIVSEFRKYQTATTQFRDKYNALPGDMSTASSYWASAGNGNGDGMIKNTATANTNEVSLFWIHLSSGGFVEGSYTNVADSTTAMVAGTNNPRSKVSGAGWNVAYLGTVGYDSSSSAYTGARSPAADSFYDGTFDHVLLIGGGTNSLRPTGILEGNEAYGIDFKIDDGKPATGDVTAMEYQGNATAGSGCGNAASSAVATLVGSAYDLKTTSRVCSLVFKLGY